ncbi:Uncharacterised protein [Bordetella pertussis]|nr:Uncharacterised protein [Bordetella pertussis]
MTGAPARAAASISLGLTAQAISSISGVTAHSRFMRVRSKGRMA